MTVLLLCSLIAGCDDKAGQIYSPPEWSDPAHPADSAHPPAVRIVAPAKGSVFHAPAEIRLLALATPHGTSLEPNAWTKRYADTNKWNFHHGPPEITLAFQAGTNSIGSTTSGMVNANMRSQHGEAVPFVVSQAGYPQVEFVWHNVPAGKYTLTAVATNLKGLAATSSPVSITVLP